MSDAVDNDDHQALQGGGMPAGPALVLFGQDLRLTDNPALAAGSRDGRPVIPVYIWWHEAEHDPWTPGAAAQWWIRQSLQSLNESLHERGSRLIIRTGRLIDEVDQLIEATGATAVHWNRRYEPTSQRVFTKLKKHLVERGIEASSHNASLLFEPWEVQTQQDKPYQVFSPFWRACQKLDEPARPADAPTQLPGPEHWPCSQAIDDLGLLPNIDWAAGLRETWTVGEAGAADRLRAFLDGPMRQYSDDRNRPDIAGSSMLSPYLHHGELSPRQVWHDTRHRINSGLNDAATKSAWAFLRELGWREFGYHLLHHFPHTTDAPLRDKYSEFPWREDSADLHAWHKGETGYPMVDAGMRQLWQIGWMHNRVRMIVASFLVKDLRISWLTGARWFWDTLVDADLASNTLGWQWAGGCGADAAPYFRVFNPVLQGERFDPRGDYVRRYIPELADVTGKKVHKPGQGIDGYPPPMVDHKQAREQALEAFEVVKDNDQ